MGPSPPSNTRPNAGVVPDDLFAAFLGRLGPEDLEPSLEVPLGAPHTALLDRMAARAELLPRYAHEAEIGRGGVGVVLRARDLELGRTVAMKLLASDDPSADHVERFLEEARVTGQLDHPGIVSVHELGMDADGRPFFTMQLVRGRDLASLLVAPEGQPKARPEARSEARSDGESEWSTPRALQVLVRVCEAVAFAHDRGVLHRDLKPANVMVGGFGEVYVMDWGLAKVLERSGVQSLGSEGAARVPDSLATSEVGELTRTRVGTVMGTPAYMSPEQARGEIDRLDARSDIYSLGALLYFVLARRQPYEGVTENVLELVDAVKDGPPAPLYRIAPTTPAELIAICEKAMAREPEQRYASAMALASDLRAFLEGRVVTAHRVGALTELVKWVQRNRAIAATSTALLLAITVGFAVSTALYVQARERAQELQLSAVDMHSLRFRDLMGHEPELWPPGPEHQAALEAWVEKARELTLAVPELVAVLEGFASDDPRLEQLRTLNEALEQMNDPVSGVLAADCAPHGLSVMKRLEIARDLEWRSLRSPVARSAWEKTNQTLASAEGGARYGALRLPQQMGLLPLGPDPDSGLLEFADLMTGEPPTRDPASGALSIFGHSALVFVLVPAGNATIGSSRSAADPRHVPDLPEFMLASECPPITVELEAFLLAKHEVSQAQWRRWTGENPSLNLPGQDFGGVEVSELHPVEQVSWQQAVEVLARFGLLLPTEAQWEYAARAGTTTPWWTGAEPRSLVGQVNLADLSATRAKIPTFDFPEWAEYDDGWPVHAPVTAGAANRFGLVHVLGNVNEWCQDPRAGYPNTPRGRFGVALSTSALRVLRGGAFTDNCKYARSAYRGSAEPTYRDSVIGLRPMRPIEP